MTNYRSVLVCLLFGFSLTLTLAVNAVPTFYSLEGYAIHSSPSGRYLTVVEKVSQQDRRLWICTLRTRHWRLLFSGIAGNYSIHWLSGERKLLVGIAPSISSQGAIKLYSIPMNRGRMKCIARIEGGIDWLPLPDGRGIVATTIDPRNRCKGGETFIRGQIKLFSFATGHWRTVAHTPWTLEGQGTGIELALRRHGGCWVASFLASGPDNESSLWVNLSTGACALGDKGQGYQYSPDGRYVLTHEGIFRALSWPQPRRGHLGRVLGPRITKLHYRKDLSSIYLEPGWASDSRQVLLTEDIGNGVTYRFVDFRRYDIVRRRWQRRIVLKGKTSAWWVGSHHVLFGCDNGCKYEFATRDGSHRRLIFRTKM